MVGDQVTGRVFKAGDAGDLVDKARWLNGDDKRLYQLGNSARKEYEQKYTAEKNYEILISIYEQTIDNYRK